MLSAMLFPLRDVPAAGNTPAALKQLHRLGMTNAQAQETPVILITRPEASGRMFADQIAELIGNNHDIIQSPLLVIERFKSPPNLSDIKTLIFTSAHAVRAFVDLEKRRDFVCYVVGSATAEIAMLANFEPIDGGGHADALIEKIINDLPQTPCLYVRGEHVSSDLAGMLNAAGITTHQVTLYGQSVSPLNLEARDALNSKKPVLLPLFSARSAQLFFEQGIGSAPLHVIAMSEAVAANVPRAKVKSIRIARQPNKDGMLDALLSLWNAANQLEGQGGAQ
ncbi:MAG: uroporphyrinogen-III synthase [Pseudomonadota bacterium]